MRSQRTGCSSPAESHQGGVRPLQADVTGGAGLDSDHMLVVQCALGTQSAVWVSTLGGPSVVGELTHSAGFHGRASLAQLRLRGGLGRIALIRA